MSEAEQSNTGDTTVCILHDASSTGDTWNTFIGNMFGEKLPEEHRSLNLDISIEILDNISSDAAKFASNNKWRILLLTSEVVEMLRDEQSAINRHNIMQAEDGGLIVLLIGNSGDMNYERRASESLHRYSSYPYFHLVRVKDTEQIFFDIVELLSPVAIEVHPTTISYEDSHQCLMFISNKPYKRDGKVSYSVQFLDGDSSQKVMKGVLVNPYTLLVENPRHTPGILNVKVFEEEIGESGERETVKMQQLGGKMQVWQLSDLDRLYTILDKQNNPIQFLGQAMKLNSGGGDTVEKIDRYLVESFKKNVPSDKLEIVFGNDQGFDANQDLRSDQCVPTLLHFSAMYGLCELTSYLLQCPGALRAFGTANCDDDYPTNLAEKYGHWHLKEYMTKYMEVSAMVDEEYGSLHQTSLIVSNLVNGEYLSFNQLGDDLYSSNSAEEDFYLPMTPMIVPIGQDVEEDEKKIQKLLEGNEEDLYETLTHPNAKGMSFQPQRPYKPSTYTRGLDVAAEVRPPLPPPRESGSRSTPSSEAPKPPMAYKDINIPVVPALMSPAQQELITLQQKVKTNEITINQALLRFKEWGQNHKERAASFQYQQERLEKIRQSIVRRKQVRGLPAKSSIEISQPVASGSSTYDRILVKTNKDAGPEVVAPAYGTVETNHRHAVDNPYKTTPSSGMGIDYGHRRISRFASQNDKGNFTKGVTRKPSAKEAPPLPVRDEYSRPHIPPRIPKR